ncbi:unnamed protein product [marine sediment metagenome]|uniref:Uncharacterized protein n=1 Tax=marine sediment metagenome TaxID=412755 RepID=X0TCU8_9ZZZZ
MTHDRLGAVHRFPRALLFFFAVLLLAGAAQAGDSGRCHSAVVSSEMVLPDGSVHGPGRLRVCAVRTHSPTSMRVDLSVDGYPIHMVISRTTRGKDRTAVKDPFFVFQFDDDKRLVLLGLAYAKGGRLQTHAMYDHQDRFEVTSSWELLSRGYQAGAPQDESIVLVAAAR